MINSSFNLSGQLKNRPPETWQEHAYERLKVLYGVGKLLASNESIQDTFPKILDLASDQFPFMTAVLIENKGQEVGTELWIAQNTAKDAADLAIQNAKKSFEFLTGNNGTLQKDPNAPSNFIALPLIVDNLPAFGIIQLEFREGLNEQDLEFADALSALIAVAVDRHHKAKLERQLKERQAKESAVKLSDSQHQVAELVDEKSIRESFVSLLSHDLRTPLSAAKISAQLILREASCSESAQTLAARIVSNINRAIQMIGDLLDSNRLRSGEKLPVFIKKLNLTSFARLNLQELSSIHGDRFVLNCAEEIEGYWDPTALRRVFENLGTNAIKYGNPDTSVTFTIKKHDSEVRIEVQNEGDVISAEEQMTLFEQFRRTKKSEGSSKKGWGLGLTLVRGVAEAHGGTVKVTSTKESGTTFTVILPQDARSHG